VFARLWLLAQPVSARTRAEIFAAVNVIETNIEY
jgi:hypothetical protein